MTELGYQADTDAAYVRSFEAEVVALPPGAVVLDRTYFYAVGGGQPADRGRLVAPTGASVEIADVGRTGGEVLHRLARRSDPRALAVGMKVRGEIDWERRYAHMRLHTGQHLASALLFRTYGLRTDKAALGQGSARIELEAPLLSEPSFAEWVRSFEDAVAADRAVAVRHLDRGAYEAAPAPRSGRIPLPPGIDRVRLIEIDGLDAAPCGGTHLRRTGEIGPVRFTPPGPTTATRVAFDLVVPPTPTA